MKANLTYGPLSLKFGGEVAMTLAPPNATNNRGTSSSPNRATNNRGTSPRGGNRNAARPAASPRGGGNKPQPFANMGNMMAGMGGGPGPAAGASGGGGDVQPDRVIKLIKGKKNLRAKQLDKKIKDLMLTEWEDGNRAYFFVQNKTETNYTIWLEFTLSLYEVPEQFRVEGEDASTMELAPEAGSEILGWLDPKAKQAGKKPAGGGFGGMGMAAMMADYEVAERSFRPYKVKVDETEE